MKRRDCLWALLPFLLTACYKTIDLEELRTDPKLVINALAVENDTFRVELSRTWFYTDGSPADEELYISGADVQLYVNDAFRCRLSERDSVYQTEGWTEDGFGWIDRRYLYYLSDYVPRAGDRLRVVATKEGFPKATAEVELPASCPVSDMQVDIHEVARDTSEYTITDSSDVRNIRITQDCALRFTLNDPPGRNFYLLYMRANAWEDFYGVRWYSMLPYCDEEPVFSNRFSALDQILNEDLNFDYNGIAFTDELFDGQSYSFNLPWGGTITTPTDKTYFRKQYVVFLYSISESYYNYMRMLNQLNEGSFTGDLADIGLAEPIRVYSNVEGGTGILGGACLYWGDFVGE